MTKRTLVIGIAITLILIIIGVTAYFANREFKMGEEEKRISNIIFDKGCIRDEATAIAIASLIIDTTYPDFADWPVSASFDIVSQAWLIKTEPPENVDNGGGVYLVINKSNSEVVAIWAYA